MKFPKPFAMLNISTSISYIFQCIQYRNNSSKISPMFFIYLYQIPEALFLFIFHIPVQNLKPNILKIVDSYDN